MIVNRKIKSGEILGYSDIIDAENYNRIISKEHLYVPELDSAMFKLINHKFNQEGLREIVEIGCGPNRQLPLISQIPNISLTAIDIDSHFVEYTKKNAKDLPVSVIEADILSYQHSKPVSIFYSQGVHHHIPKGNKTEQYLKNVFKQLQAGGYYILSDEFIPKYNTLHERDVRLIIWYSHVIANAMQNGFDYLAQEETKTLLDDLAEAKECSNRGVKTQEQLDLVFHSVNDIDFLSQSGDFDKARLLAESLLNRIGDLISYEENGDHSMEASRKDYKISRDEFIKEVEPIGFTVDEVVSIGPVDNIGGMQIYVLKK